MPREQTLGGEVVLEGEGFDEFLQARGGLALVTPGVWVLQVGEEGVQEGGDCGEAGGGFGGYGGGEGVGEGGCAGWRCYDMILQGCCGVRAGWLGRTVGGRRS